MKLDNFQQFVKNGEYEADLTADKAKYFLMLIACSKRVEIMSTISLSLDIIEIIRNSIYGHDLKNECNNEDAIKLHVNQLIQKTLEEIEDIEEYNKTEVEPEDCTDADKRYWELHRDG